MQHCPHHTVTIPQSRINPARGDASMGPAALLLRILDVFPWSCRKLQPRGEPPGCGKSTQVSMPASQAKFPFPTLKPGWKKGEVFPEPRPKPRLFPACKRTFLLFFAVENRSSALNGNNNEFPIAALSCLSRGVQFQPHLGAEPRERAALPLPPLQFQGSTIIPRPYLVSDAHPWTDGSFQASWLKKLLFQLWMKRGRIKIPINCCIFIFWCFLGCGNRGRIFFSKRKRGNVS